MESIPVHLILATKRVFNAKFTVIGSKSISFNAIDHLSFVFHSTSIPVRDFLLQVSQRLQREILSPFMSFWSFASLSKS